MAWFLAHSKNELIKWRGDRRLSVCLSVRLSINFWANRFFSQANGPIATKLAHNGHQVNLHPGVFKVKVNVKGHVIRALSWFLRMSYSVIDGLVFWNTFALKFRPFSLSSANRNRWCHSKLHWFRPHHSTKFGQLILRKITEIVATRCHLFRYTKFDFGWGSAPDLAGGTHSAPPDPRLDFRGPHFSECTRTSKVLIRPWQDPEW